MKNKEYGNKVITNNKFWKDVILRILMFSSAFAAGAWSSVLVVIVSTLLFVILLNIRDQLMKVKKNEK